MSIEIKEYCDCCGREIHTNEDGVTYYRNKIKWFHKPYWPRFANTEEEWQVICSRCWESIGEAVRNGERTQV